MEPLILSLMLLFMLVLFILEAFTPEVTALMTVSILVLLSSLGLGLNFLTPEEGIAGFSNSAVVTVASMFVISAGLMRTGAVGFIGDRIIQLSKGRPMHVLAFSMLAVAFFSCFVNNTPVVVLFLPIMLRVCYKYNLSPSKFLIPLSYASILGGTCTLLGTSTNILVSDIMASYTQTRPELGLHRLGMFDLAPVGIVSAVLGLLLMLLLSQRVLPERKTVTGTIAGTDQKSFMTELEIQESSPCIGRSVGDAILSCYDGLNVMEVIRGESVIYPPVDDVTLQNGDILLTKGTANDLVKVLRDESAVIAPELGVEGMRMTERNITLAEVVIMPTSEFIGKSINQVRFKRRYDVNVIAILRKGRHMHMQEQIGDVPLAVGDTLLVQGGEDAIDRVRGAENVLLLEGIGESVFNPRKAPIALAIISAVILGASLNLMPIMPLALTGALLTVVSGCLTVKDAYKSLDASVLVLIACTIALGTAMGKTGTAQMYADFVVSLVEPFGPVMVIGMLFLLTSFLTEFISNNATAVLLTPVAIAAGLGLGYQPMPFVMAVLFGASACYATPIGYQTNLFVYGPGGYRFTDYLKLGLPLNLLVLVVATTLIPLVWPLVPIS